MRCHPDKNGGDVAAFVAVNRAFETLSDPASRRAYDAALTSRLRQVVVSDEIDLEDMDVEEAGPPVTRTTAGEGGDPDFDGARDETRRGTRIRVAAATGTR